MALTENNLGFMDQREAVHWVRRNIAAFGGDPDKITLFGESAGGFSIMQLIGSPPEPLPFRAAILQSKGASFALNRADHSLRAWNKIVDHMGCSNSTSQLACMRQVPFDDLRRYLQSGLETFSPLYDNKTMVHDFREALSGDRAIKIPFIIGYNLHEAQLFANRAGLTKPHKLVAQHVHPLIDSYVEQYPYLSYVKTAVNTIAEGPFELYNSLVSHLIWTCPTALIAEHAHKSGHEVYQYYLNTDYDTSRFFPGAKAYHGSELPILFDSYPDKNQHGSVTAEQREMTRYLQSMWGAFAKDPIDSLKSAGWEEFGDGRVNYIGKDGQPSGQMMNAKELKGGELQFPLMDPWCAQYNNADKFDSLQGHQLRVQTLPGSRMKDPV